MTLFSLSSMLERTKEQGGEGSHHEWKAVPHAETEPSTEAENTQTETPYTKGRDTYENTLSGNIVTIDIGDDNARFLTEGDIGPNGYVHSIKRHVETVRQKAEKAPQADSLTGKLMGSENGPKEALLAQADALLHNLEGFMDAARKKDDQETTQLAMETLTELRAA